MKVERIIMNDWAKKDLQRMPKGQRTKICEKIDAVLPDLAGDVKQLISLRPQCRLSVGRYQVIFEVCRRLVIIYRITHRKDVYR